MAFIQKTVDFFLGSLSPSGFTGWFREAAAEPDTRPYLIKAGPGCGKSTFMRRVAERDFASPCVELLHCSSDPASLDGAKLPGCGALLLDATAPHTLDCKFPGAEERVLSFYDTLNDPYLQANRDEILAAARNNAAHLRRAAALFALYCGLQQQARQEAAQALLLPKLTRDAQRLAARTMPARAAAAPGARRHRLLSAPTPGGVTFFYDTIPALADTLYALHDPYGAAAPRVLQILADHARANGYDAILCHDPADQTQLEHLLIPALRLAFVTANSEHPMLFADQINLRPARWMDPAQLAPHSAAIRREKQLAAGLLADVCAEETAAKAAHDEIERWYVAATDFAAVDGIRAALERELFCR